jgi:hypothetical protein
MHILYIFPDFPEPGNVYKTSIKTPIPPCAGHCTPGDPTPAEGGADIALQDLTSDPMWTTREDGCAVEMRKNTLHGLRLVGFVEHFAGSAHPTRDTLVSAGNG